MSSPVSESKRDPEDEGLKFRLRVLVKHPFDALADLTSAFGVAPMLHWKAGDERQSAAGTSIPGRQRESLWSWWIDVENKRYFSDAVTDVLETLDRGKECIRRVVSTGGAAVLIVELQGGRNIGDVIGLKQLAQLADIGIQLGIEVFPD